MRVLVACEYSGHVRQAFRDRGHDAWSCDILPTDKPGNHIQDDVLKHLDEGWDLMIAHPPCTYLCVGGNNWLNRRPDLKWRENRELGAAFFMAFINAPIGRIAVENPIGCMSSRYRKPNQIIRPFMFGHPYRKDVCLWLKNLPKLMPTYEQEENLFFPVENGRKKLDFWSTARNVNGRSMKSITFPGIALAMASQWG